jgi:hypothetical protein
MSGLLTRSVVRIGGVVSIVAVVSVIRVFMAERGTDGAAPGIGVEGLDVFVLGDGDGLEHGLGEIGESGGDFGFYFAAGDGAKETRHGDAEIAGGQQFCGEEARNVLTDLLGGEGFGFFLGVEVTEIQMAGAARGAALTTIGKGESTQVGGTVFLRFGRRTDFFLCGRNTANRAFHGHRILLKVRFEL